MSAQPVRHRGGGKGRLQVLSRRALPLLIALQVGLLSAAGAPGGGAVPTPAGVSVARLSRQVQPSVVDTITFADPAGTQILGTGIIVSSSGLVLTDYHVIRDDVFVGVRVGGTGEVHPATVVLTDPDDDLALLQIQDAPTLKPAELARTSSAAVGDPVLAIGNAMGLGQVPRAVAGRLVALHRSISYGVGSGTVDLDGVIEAEAPIFAGDSGGALVDATGHVIGLIAAGSDDGPCAPAAVCPLYLAYAIPIHTALTQIGYTTF
jgi:S1-C subfamily serine protease